MKKPKQIWELYIIECKDGSFYTGITIDVKRRLTLHETGKGAKYTRGRAPLKLVYRKSFKSKSAALVREAKIKSMTKAEKVELVKSWLKAEAQSL